MSYKAKYCRKCGTDLKEGTKFCHKCGVSIINNSSPESSDKNASATNDFPDRERTNSSNSSQSTSNNTTHTQQTKPHKTEAVRKCKHCGTPLKEGLSFCNKCGEFTSLQNTSYASQNSSSKSTSSSKPSSGSSLDRYEEGGDTVFYCVAGMVAAIIGFFTLNANWISINDPYFGSLDLTLKDISEFAKNAASLTQYFSAEATSTYNGISLIATLSYWVLILGGIVMIIAAIAALVSPVSMELPGTLTVIIILYAFAAIGLIFVGYPLFSGDLINAKPSGIVMLIFAGAPVLFHRTLG